MSQWQEQQIVKQQARLDDLYKEIDQHVRKNNYLMVELEVEKNAAKQTQTEMIALREEVFQLEKELNFYQKVLAPELVADGLAIEQFAVEQDKGQNRFKFQFAVVQTDSKKRNAKGYVQLNILGYQEGKRTSLDLAELSKLDKKDLRFSFRYFQYFEGQFKLPEGFEPTDVEIKVVQPKTKWQAYKAFTEKRDWPDL
ncbi:hypothetical protein J1N51_07295 [Psychrosphaera ytuae]|uniref:Uncharacterized protein n=1 Tax=Psychrosphaera ytuae TaxID=2820710 RepID=A0A975DDL5_9GAMM|nr:DUF6776 family protein [Psychrosphaera ytuae]QTH65225.1 hypothetical protein J1N51_07295 [Psychrosphaera ytuae]